MVKTITSSALAMATVRTRLCRTVAILTVFTVRPSVSTKASVSVLGGLGRFQRRSRPKERGVEGVQ
jgi:hypothetical protein